MIRRAFAVEARSGSLPSSSVACKRCGRPVAMDERMSKPGIRCSRCGFTFRVPLDYRCRASSASSNGSSPASDRGNEPAASALRIVEKKPKALPVAPNPERVADRARAQWLTDESFRTLRTNLLTRLPEGAQALLITSSRPREGKSTVAVNLAWAFAAAGKSVVLVDADLRRPIIHRFFRTGNELGLTDVLSGRKNIEDAWHSFPSGPTVLASGAAPDDPQRPLSSSALDETLADLKDRFDFVIIDSVPFLAVADAALIAPKVDGVILVLRHGVVTEAEALKTKARLESVGARIVGAVFNGLEDSSRDTYHPYSREYAGRDDV